MSTSHQDEQELRRATFEHDRRLREQQGSTFHQFAEADADIPLGRFSAVAQATVIGSKATIDYPAASAAHQIQLPDEPPLDDNPAFEPGQVSPAQAAGGADASSPRDTSASSLSSGDPAGVSFPSPPVTSSDVQAGSPPSRPLRRY